MKSSKEGQQTQNAPAPARPSRIWLVVTALLFCGWIGYLAFLAFTAADPVVLSRPQLLVSSLDVIAEVEAQPDGRPNPLVRVIRVHWPKDQEGLAGKELPIVDLEGIGPEQGWSGPGPYILPLMRRQAQLYLTPTPPSPGFDPYHSRAGRPRIYPLTPETQRQLESIQKPEL